MDPPSHHNFLHPTPSRLIPSHPIPFYTITLHPIPLYPTPLHPIPFHPIPFCPISCCPILHAMPCHAMPSYPTTPGCWDEHFVPDCVQVMWLPQTHSNTEQFELEETFRITQSQCPGFVLLSFSKKTHPKAWADRSSWLAEHFWCKQTRAEGPIQQILGSPGSLLQLCAMDSSTGRKYHSSFPDFMMEGKKFIPSTTCRKYIKYWQ